MTTDSAEGQRWFDQGIQLLYGFNHDEAARYFRRAAELEPVASRRAGHARVKRMIYPPGFNWGAHLRPEIGDGLRYAQPGDVVIVDVGETVEDVGKAVVATLALVYVVLLTSGLVLWWPARWR